MTNVFQAGFPSQQQSSTHLNLQNTECGAAHARMLGKRQRSASPPSNGDESIFGHQHKRNRPFWTATPLPAGHDGSKQHVQNLTNSQGFFDFSKSAVVDISSQHQPSHYQFAQNPYPFPFPSPNNLSPSGLVLPDSTMSSNSVFPMTQGFASAPVNGGAMARESNDFAPSPLQRETSHGSFASLHELRERIASSGLRGYRDLPQVMDDNDVANDGDDEMLISDSIMQTMHIGPDSTMDVSMPRPPRNSFSSAAPGGDIMDQGTMSKPFAALLSDRFGPTASAVQKNDPEGLNVSKRSNASDGLGAAEQYFVDGMRGVEQQHKDWSSPTEPSGSEGQQHRSGGDVDMNAAPPSNQSMHPVQAHSSIEHAQANLHQHRLEQQRHQHDQVPSNGNGHWSNSITQGNGPASVSASFQYSIQVPNSTQSIHHRQKFTMGPRPDCSKCLAGSSGHAGHWM